MFGLVPILTRSTVEKTSHCCALCTINLPRPCFKKSHADAPVLIGRTENDVKILTKVSDSCLAHLQPTESATKVT